MRTTPRTRENKSKHENPQANMDFALAFGFGSATALASLAALLAKKGALEPREIELVRHQALQGFDLLREKMDLLPPTLARLEEARCNVDRLWHLAAVAGDVDRANN